MDITEVHAATEGLTKVQARELALAAKLVLNLFLLCSSARISSIYQALGGFIWFIIRESFGLKTHPARLKKKQTSPERTGLAMRLWGTSMLANRGGFMMDNI